MFYHITIFRSSHLGMFFKESVLKENANKFLFLYNLSFPWKELNNTVAKKVIVSFYNFEKKLLKIAAFVIFPTSITVFFEIHKRFKGHFLNKLHVSCKTFANFKAKHLCWSLNLIKLKAFYRVAYSKKSVSLIPLVIC